MLNLPNITLMIVDCLDSERAKVVLDKCLLKCSFGAVKLLSSKIIDSPYYININPINNLDEYSGFILKHCWKYFDTTHVQIVQHDGWILNPEAWEDDWPRYDYIGPLYLYDKTIRHESVGSGGFSLRSRKLMKFASDNLGDFIPGVGWWGYLHEDDVLSKGMKPLLNRSGFAFAPPERAAKYAYGGNKAFFCEKPFGFHGFYALRKLDKEYDDLYKKYEFPENANV